MTDNQIINRCQSGQTDLLDILIDRYKVALYTMCFKLTRNNIEADDLFQDTWVKVMINVNLFKIDQKFSTWLFAICINLYRDKYRKKKRWLKRVKSYFSDAEMQEDLDRVKSESPEPDDILIQNEQISQLKECIDKLDDMLRIPVLLFYYKEFSLEEISSIIGVPKGTVKSRLFTARKNIKSFMEVNK